MILSGIYAGGDSAFVLTHGGQLFTWGQSDHGQLGLGKDVTVEMVYNGMGYSGNFA